MTAAIASQVNDHESLDRVAGILSRADYFCDLPEKVLLEFAEEAEERQFSAGETVFTMTQYDGSELYCVVSGTAKLTTMAVEADALSVDDLVPGDVFGLEYVLGEFDEHACQAGLCADTDLTLIIIDSDRLRELVKRKPVVARAFLASFARQLVAARTVQGGEDSDPHKRICRSLFDLLERDETHTPSQWRVPVMPKHRELGEIAGASEIDAAEAVARLISDGVAKRDYPGLVITDYASFHSMAL